MRPGLPSRFFVGALLGLCGLFAEAGPEDLFERVDLLTINGATELALQILEADQPPVEKTEDWLRAERLRFAIYGEQGRWDSLAKRLDRIPAELPSLQQHAVLTHGVEIMLRSGLSAQTRKYLRELIWRGSGDSTQIAYWRRLLIQSYVLNDQLDDARIAMDRYQKDYAPTDQHWLYLHGLILLKSGSFERAAAQFSLVQNDRARVLRLLSRLRAGTDTPAQTIKQIKRLYAGIAAKKEPDAIAMQRLWSTQAEAAEMAPDLTLRVKALEKLYSRPIEKDVELRIEHQPVDLWQAYRSLGAAIGNQTNLLVGDADAWLKRAQQIKNENRYAARAIHALLAMDASDSVKKDELHARFYDVLRAADLEYVLISLYIDPVMYPRVDIVPNSVRHRIVRYAVRKRDINLAASMARDLTRIYAGQDPLEWNLIRAQLAIYSGEFTTAGALLEGIVKPSAQLDPNLASRVMQLVFDLQSVDQFEQALGLLQLMQTRVAAEQQKRELYFWRGDSLKGMGRYAHAAEQYLRSAAYGGQDYDIWGQTARYHAAEALAEGGMFEDAREIYRGLLRVVTEPNRVIAIERSIQDLWLREKGHESDEVQQP